MVSGAPRNPEKHQRERAEHHQPVLQHVGNPAGRADVDLPARKTRRSSSRAPDRFRKCACESRCTSTPITSLRKWGRNEPANEGIRPSLKMRCWPYRAEKGSAPQHFCWDRPRSMRSDCGKFARNQVKGNIRSVPCPVAVNGERNALDEEGQGVASAAPQTCAGAIAASF